jgi:FlaA1/EpsC-like NDP-sugar epimerase
MGIPEATDMILKAGEISQGGELFVLKMPALYVGDLATAAIEVFAPLCGYKADEIRTKIIGKRRGEKLFEELLTDDEASYTGEQDGLFVLYSGKEGLDTQDIPFSYTSNLAKKISVNEIKNLLIEFCS